MFRKSLPDYKSALVTGASSGIGAATARKLAAKGLKLLLVARRIDRLAALAEEIQVAGGEAETIQADLCIESERKYVIEQAIARTGGVDVLVNNAGLGWYGYYEDMPWNVAANLMEVNMTAVAHLTNQFLPHMHRQNRGHIINIGSIAGSLPNQGIALYSASKSFLDSFTTVLHRELKGTQVQCSIVRAGPVSTEFFDMAEKRPSGLRVPAEKFAITSQAVADRIWGLLLRPRRVIYVPRPLAIAPWLEILFGGIIDRLGPILLKRAAVSASTRSD